MGNKDRGSGTHGHGSSKKNRGAGSRGGRGKAGLGKKAKHKKQSVKPDYLGEKGFSRPKDLQEEKETINLLEIDQKIDKFVEQGFAEEKDGKYIFDAEEAGFDKVLGRGRLTKNIDIQAESFSSRAEEKIEENGNKAIKQD
ncbi:MAG: uL15m family ribosomal protein [Candidatus Nanohaloarchaea archaeon]|nr:uL15m family ribosomal protein [Candidatus Nanohaloarchaea archaeon]